MKHYTYCGLSRSQYLRLGQRAVWLLGRQVRVTHERGIDEGTLASVQVYGIGESQEMPIVLIALEGHGDQLGITAIELA